MVENIADRSYYLFNTLVGRHDNAHHRVMASKGRSSDDIYKIESYLNSPNSPEGIEFSLGLDIREVMCTVPKLSPAVTYHRPYDLVLDGNILVCCDNDSGLVLQDNGKYTDRPYPFAKEVEPEELLGDWYREYETKTIFTWNEAILRKGSRVIDIFHDPKFNSEQKRC